MQNLSSIAAGTYTVNVTDANGCTNSGSITITNTGAIPAQPGAISGSSTICKNTSQSFSIIAVPGANSYTWSAGPGATITLGQGTTNVTIAFSNLATASSVSVFASNGCGNGLPRTKAYTILNGTPATLTSILGPLWGNYRKVNVGYSCTLSAGATTYTWIVPAGVTINSGQGTNAINVTYGLAFTGSGNIWVTAAGLRYQYLDGATPAAERTKRVAAFQDGDGDFFLISLKAGGFGLNLTVVDYVVIADPW